MKVQFKRLHPLAQIPKKATDLAACHDVVATEIIHESESFVRCKLGFAVGLPDNYKLVLVPRSSLTKTQWVLQNSPGIGDEDFIHEYEYRFRCIPKIWTENIPFANSEIDFEEQSFFEYEKFPFKPGDRIGQVFIQEVIPIEWEEVKELNVKQSNRTGGYGSSGK
jgi:dUTPase